MQDRDERESRMCVESVGGTVRTVSVSVTSAGNNISAHDKLTHLILLC